MLKQLMTSSLILMAILTLHPEKTEPTKIILNVGGKKIFAIQNERTGLWDVTWRIKQPYLLSVSIDKALINVRF
ncbi:MAG: hypothetical protein K0R55_1876 [Sporomusa sp.]|nr:hypothetical protein [Sporomusa sp.]